MALKPRTGTQGQPQGQVHCVKPRTGVTGQAQGRAWSKPRLGTIGQPKSEGGGGKGRSKPVAFRRGN